MEALKNKLLKFAKERNWQQFHSPKNLTMSLSCEVAELLEIFMWLTEDQACQIMQDPKQAEAVKQEMADIFNNLLYLSSVLNIDLIEAANNKIILNAKKYPVPKNLSQ